jgi:hypothetical protein
MPTGMHTNARPEIIMDRQARVRLKKYDRRIRDQILSRVIMIGSLFAGLIAGLMNLT